MAEDIRQPVRTRGKRLYKPSTRKIALGVLEMMDDPHAQLELLFKTYIHDRREKEGAENCEARDAVKVLTRRMRDTRRRIIKLLERDQKWQEKNY